MQIVVKVGKPNDLQENGRTNRDNLIELLNKLREKGYKVNTLYGNFLYDVSKQEIIDTGKFVPLKNNNVTKYVDSLYLSGARLFVIFKDEKHVTFIDTSFIASLMVSTNKQAPLSILEAKQQLNLLFI